MAETKKIVTKEFGGMQDSKRKPFASGAALIKNFDIYTDRNKLIPVAGFTSLVTEAEKAINFKALGGTSSTLYGVGYALSNWYAQAWDYRVAVTADAGSSLPVRFLDLALMPSGFWDNVQDDGRDIVLVSKDTGVPVYTDLRNFDQAAHEGQLWFNSAKTDFYVYYGSDEGSLDFVVESTAPFSSRSKPYSTINWLFHLDGDTKNAGNSAEELEDGNTPVFTDNGFFGQGLTGCTVSGEEDDALGNVGTEFYIAFSLYYPAFLSGVALTGIIDHSGGEFEVGVNSSNKLTFAIDGVNDDHTATSTATLTTNAWNHVLCHFVSGDYYIYLNGALDTTVLQDDGDLDLNAGYLRFKTDFTAGNIILNTVLSDNLSTQATGANIASEWYDMLTDNGSLYTVGSIEQFSGITPEYSGVGIYTGSIESGGWDAFLGDGDIPLKSLINSPTPSFVENENSPLTLVSSSTDINSLWYQTEQPTAEPYDFQGTALTLFNSVARAMPVAASPSDRHFYYAIGGSTLYDLEDGASAFSAYSTVQSLEPYQVYLAIASNRRNRAALEIWDLLDQDPIEFIDLGTGYVRVAGMAGDSLFAVIDGFIDDEVLSAKKPVMEIKEYVGNSRAVTRHRFEIPVNTDAGTVLDWEMPVSQLKTHLKDYTLFYAKLPVDATATTFNQGLWAVGKNPETDTLDVSLYVETDALGDLEFVHTVGNQLAVIHGRDGSVSRLRDDGVYNLTSVYETLFFNDNDPENEKKLKGVELYFDTLPEGQEVSVLIRVNGTSTWTRLFTHSVVGTTTRECVQVESTEENLPNFKDLEIRIESTGGAAPITGYAILYEVIGNDIP